MNRNDVEQMVDALKNKAQDSHVQVAELRDIAVAALDAISNIHESVEADEDLQRGAHVLSVTSELMDLEEMSIKMQW